MYLSASFPLVTWGTYLQLRLQSRFRFRPKLEPVKMYRLLASHLIKSKACPAQTCRVSIVFVGRDSCTTSATPLRECSFFCRPDLTTSATDGQ